VSKIKHPSDKKHASLERDRLVFPLEGNKTFSKAWAKKKRKASRRARHAENAILLRYPVDESGEVYAPRKKTLKKFGVTSLSQAIRMKKGKSPQRFSLFRYSSSGVERWKQD